MDRFLFSRADAETRPANDCECRQRRGNAQAEHISFIETEPKEIHELRLLEGSLKIFKDALWNLLAHDPDHRYRLLHRGDERRVFAHIAIRIGIGAIRGK